MCLITLNMHLLAHVRLCFAAWAPVSSSCIISVACTIWKNLLNRSGRHSLWVLFWLQRHENDCGMGNFHGCLVNHKNRESFPFEWLAVYGIFLCGLVVDRKPYLLVFNTYYSHKIVRFLNSVLKWCKNGKNRHDIIIVTGFRWSSIAMWMVDLTIRALCRKMFWDATCN